MIKKGYSELPLFLQLCFTHLWLFINTSPRYSNEISLRRHCSGEIAALSEDLESLFEMSAWPVSAFCPMRTKWQKQAWSQEWGWLLGLPPPCRELVPPGSRPLCGGQGALCSPQSFNLQLLLHQFPHKMNVWDLYFEIMDIIILHLLN